MQFGVERDLLRYENKVKTTEGIHLLIIQGENNPKNVQKPSQKDHLLVNATCIGTPT
jgi:hypothetical protein